MTETDTLTAAAAPPTDDAWVSPFQLSLTRLGVGLLGCLYLVFFPLQVPLDAAGSNTWLELPRLLRGSCRLLALVLCGLLILGWWRKTSAALSVLLMAFLAAFGRLELAVAGVLSVALVATLTARGDDPLAVPPFSGNFGAEPNPLFHFSRWIWLWLTLPLVLVLFSGQAWLATPAPQLLGVLLGACAGFISARGVQRPLAVGLLVGWASALLLLAGPLALPVWTLMVLLVLNRDWLPPREPLSLAGASDSLDGPDPPIVFYDGVCGLCQTSVQLIVQEDRDARLMCAPLQGETAQRLLGVSPEQEFDSIKLHEAGVTYERSTGALRIASYLGGFWLAVSWLDKIPVALRDAVYDFVAKNRYAWFGKLDACRIPTPSERQRFLD